MKLAVVLCLIAATYAMNECGTPSPHHDLRNDVLQKNNNVAAQTTCVQTWSGVFVYNQMKDYKACTAEEIAENVKEAADCAADADCVKEAAEDDADRVKQATEDCADNLTAYSACVTACEEANKTAQKGTTPAACQGATATECLEDAGISANIIFAFASAFAYYLF